MDTSQYKQLFLQETYEHINGVSSKLLRIEENPDDPAGIDDLFRHFHSIKGMAASMGYEAMSMLSHRLEDILSGLRKKSISVNEEMIDTLLKGTDILRMFSKLIEEDRPLDIDTTEIIARINSVLAAKAAVPARAATVLPADRPADMKIGLPSSMKVESRVFDDLLNEVGELFIVRSKLREIANGSAALEFKEATHRLGRIIEELYHTVITARMIPFEELTQNLPRIVRDMSKKSGKEIELSTSGGDVKFDRTVLEHITDPLVHIIRNAIDHGIELPDERVRAGKPAKGKITINAARQRDSIIIQIKDDGRGIDIKRLKEKAAAAGVPMERLHGLSDRDALMLVCLPGLSLAKEVTDTSGRGVGMDIVKASVESIGGRLEISSEMSKGTEIWLELPITISIVRALLLETGNEQFALPVSRIIIVKDIERDEIRDDKKQPYFFYNDIKVPLVNLRVALNMPPIIGKDPVSVVVVDVNDKLRGIMVDDFKGQIDAYIKPLPQPMSRMKGITGATVLGDGRPVFLLDAAAVVT